MCGIFGYLGNQDCGKIIIEGLKSLEYRGYDSWGIALKVKKGIYLKKAIGRIKSEKIPKSSMGIGHTRWATHGKVLEKNSHPHNYNDFFVVHNGIVENYEELKKKVKGKFYSETDTEIIPKLIDYYFKKHKDFEKSIRACAQELKGNFAFVAISKSENKIIAARNGSPLVIGMKTGSKGNEFFVSSDIPSFLPYTKNLFYMNEKEIAIIDGKIRFTNFYGKRIVKKIKKVKFTLEKALKGNYKHFMLKEIYEQPEVIKETIKGSLKNGKLNFNEYFKKLKIKKTKKIIITACGTSWHSALVAEYWLESMAKIPVEVEYASEFRYRDPVIQKGTIVIAISQSGETADTIAAINEAKKKGAKIISICNVVGSTIDRISDVCLYTRAGPEIGVASTKAFTTQLIILFMLSSYLANKKGKFSNEKIKTQIKKLRKIPSLVEKILKDKKELGNIKEATKKYYKKHNSLFLGRGANYPIALEGALKLKEISYIHAEGYPAAEMKHGPIALIDKDMPSIFICVKDGTYEKIISNIQEVKARKGKVISIATKNDKEIKKISDHVIYIPEIEKELTPFLTVIPLQLLAYQIADKRGCEIDKPRNLAKSVTVE